MTLVPSSSRGTGGSDSQPIPADSTGATETTVTPDPITGTHSMQVITVPQDQSVIAVKIEGDAFPRWIMPADPSAFGVLVFGDGTFDPTQNGASIGVTGAGNNLLELSAPGGVKIASQMIFVDTLPTSNPHVAGQLYTTAGALMVSAG